MEITIIDNGTEFLPELEIICEPYSKTIISVEDLEAHEPSPTGEILILSGGSRVPAIDEQPEYYQAEIELIKNSDRPMLGICLGFQLIAKSYGGELIKLPQKMSGVKIVDITKEDGIFDNAKPLEVHAHHLWALNEVPPDLVELARSNEGVEIFKHKAKPIYGVQFHPEAVVDPESSKIIFNILDRLARQI